MQDQPPHAPTDSRQTRFARLHPRAYLTAHAIAGVLATVALLWGFAAIADAISEQGRLVRTDTALTSWIQHHDSEWGESVFNAISLLGAPVLVGLLVVVGVLYARRRDWLRVSTLFLTAGSGLALNALLKHLFHRGRPEYASEFIRTATGSFPSGHAMGSIVGYGILATLAAGSIHSTARRRVLFAATAALVIAVGVSRVYLGVHYLSDVIGGWLAGGAWLVVCITAFRFARRRV